MFCVRPATHIFIPSLCTVKYDIFISLLILLFCNTTQISRTLLFVMSGALFMWRLWRWLRPSLQTAYMNIVSLRAGQSADQILVGVRFSAPAQTSPEAHPASCIMGTGSFPGVRCCRGVTLTPHPLLVQRSKTE